MTVATIATSQVQVTTVPIRVAALRAARTNLKLSASGPVASNTLFFGPDNTVSPLTGYPTLGIGGLVEKDLPVAGEVWAVSSGGAFTVYAMEIYGV